jgi:hypothetical protein
VKNFIVSQTAHTPADDALDIDSSVCLDQESINSEVSSILHQINILIQELRVSQLDFKQQIEKMHTDCSVRLAKITELKSRHVVLQTPKKPETLVLVPSTLKVSYSLSASSKRNEDFKVKKRGGNSLNPYSRNRFLEHTRIVPSMFESI